MGKRGNWFSVVKKALSPDSKEKKDQKNRKPKKKWFGSGKSSHGPVEEQPTLPSPETDTCPPPPPLPLPKEVKLSEIESEQSKHAYSVAIATAAAAEAAVAAAHAAAEVVRLTAVPRFYGKSKEEAAAIRIQTAFRGYLARRALRALRGLVRLKTLIQGQSVKRQAATTLRCMQTLARVQSQIRARRIRMSEENQALHRQLQQKTEKELEMLKASMGEDWNDSTQSKEQMEARLLNKQEAAMRRERALAYAFSHQTLKNTSKSANPTFMDPNNPHWGWSWLERWMAARPWEARATTTVGGGADSHSIKSFVSTPGDIISKSYKNRPGTPTSHKTPATHRRQSPSTPLCKVPSISRDSDSRSSFSIQSERYYRRHSIAGSSIRDDESLASTPSVPSYMASTQSAKAKSRIPSPLGVEKNGSNPVKKRLSFTGSPGSVGPRRHSGPPAVVKDIGVNLVR